MSDSWHVLISRIHAAPQQAVIAVTGGGASAISELLSVPGGSRTLLEAVVPYSAEALADWLKRRPEHFCVEETALAMAAVAYERAKALARAEELHAAADTPAVPRQRAEGELLGVACTASLVSDRPKKGEHRCHVAVQSRGATAAYSLVLEKGARHRPAEERIVCQLILLALARAIGLDGLPALELGAGEQVVAHRAEATPLVIDLLEGRRRVAWSLPAPEGEGAKRGKPEEGLIGEGGLAAHETSLHEALPFPWSPPAGLLCGAFHPLHFGHEQMRLAAERLLGGPVYYELSIRNVDKPPLDFLSLARRRAQFTEPLALTAAPTFAEKSAALPNVAFVVGVDTAERIVQPKYYGGSDEATRAALLRIQAAGCRFLVAGRKIGDRFETLADVAMPGEFAPLFGAIPPEEFRADISSTELRQSTAAL